MASLSVRVGTRGSPLALWQARWVAERLAPLVPDAAVEIVTVRTRGDEHRGPLTGAGESGLFTSELEAAVADGRVDLAVHSLKDLPVSFPGALPVAAVPLRGDPWDALVSRDGGELTALREGGRVGTSSPRRACLVLSRRPDVEIVPLRGNVGTRVRGVEEGRVDAVVLAAAGLERLGLADRISQRMDPRDFPPAPGQGALAVQVRQGDGALYEAVSSLDDPEARETSSAERTCLAALGGGCQRPIGAYASSADGLVRLTAFVGSPDGRTVLRAEACGPEAEAVGQEVAEALLLQGAAELLG